jgi:DNA mismatch repair protein MutL
MGDGAVTAVLFALVVLVGLLAALAAATEDRPVAPQDLARELLAAAAASQACKGAIKIHRPLATGEMQELVARLFRCADPWACPHGRPTVLRMSDAELERRFGRR